MAALRDSGAPDGMDAPEWMSLHGSLLGLFRLKFGWAHEPPYTVWSIQDSASASAFLAAHDAQLVAGTPVHRVTHYLAGHDSWTLRHDLMEMAHGSPLSVRLWTEQQAYGMCPLDETAIEAVHRDVTHIGKRAPASVIAHRAATLRLEQNLCSYDALGPVYQDTVRDAYFRSSAIVRPGSPFFLRKVRRLCTGTLTAAATFAYRCGASK